MFSYDYMVVVYVNYLLQLFKFTFTTATDDTTLFTTNRNIYSVIVQKKY